LALGLSGARAEAEKLAKQDLDDTSVNNNLRFYEAFRAAPTTTPPVLPATAAVPTPSPLPTPSVAVAAAPPPVVVPPAPPQPAIVAPPPAQAPPIEPPAPSVAPSAVASAAPEIAPPAPAVVGVPMALAPVTPRPVESAGQFAVQLAVYQKLSGIAAGWQKYKSGFADVIGKLEPRVATVDLGDGRGALYRLKAGPFQSASAAETACRKLKSGGADCKVSAFDGAPAEEYWKEHQIE
jgi:hypothetical protein